MRFSYSELLTLLRRALRSTGCVEGVTEDAANAACWLQAHGIPWLDQLAGRWHRFDSVMTSKPELVERDAANSVLDARSASFLQCGANSLDLVYANACDESLATLEIRHCLDRMLVLANIVTVARRGASAIARWSSENRLHIASIDAGNAYPDYVCYGASLGTGSAHTLYVACTRSGHGLDHYHRNKTRLDETYPVLQAKTPGQFRHEAMQSRAQGINVDPAAIKILNDAADRLLVKESDVN